MREWIELEVRVDPVTFVVVEGVQRAEGEKREKLLQLFGTHASLFVHRGIEDGFSTVRSDGSSTTPTASNDYVLAVVPLPMPRTDAL